MKIAKGLNCSAVPVNRPRHQIPTPPTNTQRVGLISGRENESNNNTMQRSASFAFSIKTIYIYTQRVYLEKCFCLFLNENNDDKRGSLKKAP